MSINPNHFNAFFDLAESYMEIKDFAKAVVLYKRAYQLDPNRMREDYVRALQSYGLESIEQQDFERAKEQFELILRIQPDSMLDRNQLKEIESYRKIKELKIKLEEIKQKLDYFDFNNFAIKRIITSYPYKFRSDFEHFKKELHSVVIEASNIVSNSELIHEFKEIEKAIDIRLVAIRKRDFDNWQETVIAFINVIEIEVNSEEQRKLKIVEERQKQIDSESSRKLDRPPREDNEHSEILYSKILISFYDDSFYDDIQIVLETVSYDIDILEYRLLKQSDRLEAIDSRIESIKQCNYAIICLPPNDRVNPLAYFDLGICMERFSNRILLIYEDELPDNLNVELSFQYLRSLDFKGGQELTKLVINMLRNSE
ncbi:MAG: tetratricopeptide repeat protein [Cyanobacteria bacterium P01_E01_bin.42]